MDWPLTFADGPWRMAMGLNALDLADWLLFDADHDAEMALKRRLLAERPGEVLAALPEAGPGAAELLPLLLAHLARHHPDRFAAAPGGGVRVLATGEDVPPRPADPLRAAGLLVQEDLCLLTSGGPGEPYRLVGASLSFPARWRLLEKLGRPLRAIHAPVPGYDGRLGAPVDRLFATLEPGRPVWRANWSVVDDPAPFQPDPPAARGGALDPADAGERHWLRVERQTVRRLPASRQVLFTIRTLVRPLPDLAAGDPGAALALAARLRELPGALLAYKGLEGAAGPLATWLEARVRGAAVGPGLAAPAPRAPAGTARGGTAGARTGPAAPGAGRARAAGG